MTSETTSFGIIKVGTPKKSDIITLRILICCAFFSMLLFIGWFVDPEHIGYPLIFWLLTFGLGFKLVKMLHEWYHYWSVSVPVAPVSTKKWMVDVLTTACPGEPKEMIIKTLQAMVNIRYPHTNYLCDEGNDPELKQVCDQLGVIHITRAEKINAKAGNINNALKQATGEICVVLDPDHVPIPEFLDRVLAYFEDSSIGFVQSVQAYCNQSESIIARGAAEQTYHFYGPMMMCMNTYGTVQAIGANCVFRRSSLDSIGGHAAGLSEDMHTAMQLHAKGWKSVYVPEILTRGLVPATLSSYYKQQLKWSRGTFELLFRTYPALFKKFTWRQKIHYFTIPLYFFFGLINLIDIAIPVLALGMAEVPWEVNLGNFAVFFLPLCIISMLIRMFAQRWLLEEHERGFHLAGGVLRLATWWIFIIGFVYTIFNIKVPYIPTPKEDEHKNYWKLSLPNLLVLIITVLSTLYGLSIDWCPYSFAMAFYALINAGMLGVIVMMSQQQLLDNASVKVKRIPIVNWLISAIGNVAVKTEHIIYGMIRIGPVALLIATSLLFFSYSNIDDDSERATTIKSKEIGGFYKGMALQKIQQIDPVIALEKATNNFNEILSVTTIWNDSLTEFPMSELQKIDSHHSIPLVNWLPATTDSCEIYNLISTGKYDRFLERSAKSIRQFRNPVFLNFAPGFDDPVNSWCIKGGNSHNDFIDAWQYMYTFFNDLGVSNITWIWSPRYASSKNCYPGPKFVDWIGFSGLNYGDITNDNDWFSFGELYAPLRNSNGGFQKPVIIYEFGTVRGPDQQKWLADATQQIASRYKEIKGLVFYNQKKKINVTKQGEVAQQWYSADFALSGDALLKIFGGIFKEEPFNKIPLLNTEPFYNFTANSNYHSSVISGKPGDFKLMVHNKPFYIRGVAYNTAHDWRDGNMPLTRRRVEKDFTKIKEMGANTVRRYDHGIFDRNVLNIAKEFDLKVLYGFWFDPKIDYYKDTVKVNEYIQNITEKVVQYKDHSSVLAWSLGNETWGLLKHRYTKPYLITVRNSYVKMIETIARKIHELDPERAVFSCIEHEEYQLPGEIVALRDGAPSIDAIGINSYYREQISELNHVAWHFDSLRPYLVSEFGPRGYWDPAYTKIKNGSLEEDNNIEKSEWYKEQWSKYILAHKGYNIGGFAYCWHDRMEGSNTWFGLTDFKGRPKPSYYALKELWTNAKSSPSLPSFRINVPEQMAPGNEYIFEAIASTGKAPSLKYEWYLHKDEFLERVENITSMNGGRSARVEIPKLPSDYRLYLYASDDFGNVTTTSVPIKVKASVK
ncbi:MAG: glycosyltransferase [Bacteroidetes bacterium]|nr:glycosyltransferase [Bacteroidota bacterium]